MSFCIALAVREMGMTIEEALRGGDARRRAGAAPRPTSAAWRPAPAPTRSSSTRPRYAHLVYRPGVPLVHSVLRAGEVIFGPAGKPRE